MSDAKAPSKDIFSIALCSQCLQPFSPSSTRDVRHAVPCGHVFCKECVNKVEAAQPSGKPVCRRAGCERELARTAEFAASWAAQRAERIKAKQLHMFTGQGNVGDLPPPTCAECDPDPDTGKPHRATHKCESCGDGVYFCDEVTAIHKRLKATKDHVVVALAEAVPKAAADLAWDLCAKHKLPFRVVEAATHRPLCAECMVLTMGKVPVQSFDDAIAVLQASAAAVSAELAKQRAKLAEPTFTADELCASISKWGAEETARIRAWEEREVKHVQAVANESVKLVQEVCARRTEVGASLIVQRMGLRASLEEFDQALANLPSDPAANLSKTQAVHTERKQLCELLAGSKIAVPSAQEILKWAELPALSAEFDQKDAGSGGVLANAVSAAAKVTLGKARNRTPEAPARAPEEKAKPVFPVIPKLDADKGLRSITMSSKPNVFVALDDGTAVVGLADMSPLQVWDLAAGKLVREFEGKGSSCRSMINLPAARIAVGWSNGTHCVVTIFAATTGKYQQELTGFGGIICGLAFVEDHLLTMCYDKSLRVWSQDVAGRFTEKAKFATTGALYGMVTALSPSTIAMSTTSPAQIEIWDWKAGKCVKTLTGFGGGYALANAVLPDGRFVVGDSAGILRVGSLDNWTAATTASNGGRICGVLAGQDGSFVTTDESGNIKLWRNGACEVTLPGGFTSAYDGLPLAVVGRRLVVVGLKSNLLVTE